jgi:PAS domain S-box-containing protein
MASRCAPWGLEELRSRAFCDQRKEYSAEYRIVRSGGEIRWIESRYFVSYRSDGPPQRVVGVNIDVTERKKAEQVAHRLASIVECSDDAIVSKDLNGVIVSWNHGAERLFGYAAEEVIGSPIWILIPPDRQPEEEMILRRIRIGERISHYETVRRRKDGTLADVSLTISPLRDATGAIIGASKIARDISARKRADEHQRTLNAELDHRVKNVLATVGAIIIQTQKAEGSLGDFVAGLDDRIKSLARTHELLSESRWHGALLEDIVQRELAPYGGDNAEIGGPRVTLKAGGAQAVSMVLHELATNAAKHGALSTPGGRLSLRWRWLGNGSRGRLAIEWQESGGPPVQEPGEPGYGTSIVRELIPYELGGTAHLDFAAIGLHCRLEIPADWLLRPSRPSNKSGTKAVL